MMILIHTTIPTGNYQFDQPYHQNPAQVLSIHKFFMMTYVRYDTTCAVFSMERRFCWHFSFEETFWQFVPKIAEKNLATLKTGGDILSRQHGGTRDSCEIF